MNEIFSYSYSNTLILIISTICLETRNSWLGRLTSAGTHREVVADRAPPPPEPRLVQVCSSLHQAQATHQHQGYRAGLHQASSLHQSQASEHQAGHQSYSVHHASLLAAPGLRAVEQTEQRAQRYRGRALHTELVLNVLHVLQCTALHSEQHYIYWMYCTALHCTSLWWVGTPFCDMVEEGISSIQRMNIE